MAVLYYGISATGTRLCFYTKPHGEAILPQQIIADTETDTAPPERWNCDIWEHEGEKKLRCVVNEIKDWQAEVRNGSYETKKQKS